MCDIAVKTFCENALEKGLQIDVIGNEEETRQ